MVLIVYFLPKHHYFVEYNEIPKRLLTDKTKQECYYNEGARGLTFMLLLGNSVVRNVFKH